MNIQHRLIKDEFDGRYYINSEEITVALDEELKELIYNDIKDITIYDLESIEIEDNDISFNYTASFDDMPAEWQRRRDTFVYISFNKDTNFEEPYCDRDWN